MVVLFKEGLKGEAKVFPHVITTYTADYHINELVSTIVEACNLTETEYSVWFMYPTGQFTFKLGNENTRPSKETSIIDLKMFGMFDYILCSSDYSSKVLISSFLRETYGV